MQYDANTEARKLWRMHII
uniref:Uncharacterized protein n=1 Tax=Arundo donax TaxID=35708 RepID=A0A0A9GZB9_ARUDO